jgi:mannose-6-phosphate isomerase-like protein (cupin superfamily)
MAHRTAHFRITECLGKTPPEGNLAIPVFSHGTLVLELYAPHRHDLQKPHGRDEIYFITAGEGWFNDGETRYAVGPGSFLFVPAGCMHRFEDFSADFSTWVVFYGPDGGESATAHVAEV